MTDLIVLLIGISGVLVVGLNFILEATNKLAKDHHVFAYFNLYGAIALLLYSWYNEVWLFVVLNTFLSVVGIYGVYKVHNK